MGGIRRDELRQKGQKEEGEFGIHRVDEKTVGHDPDGRYLFFELRNLQRTFVPQDIPGHVEQIDNTHIFDDLKSHCAGMQQSGQPNDTGHDMRNDPHRAAECGDNACPHAAPKSPRQSV